MTWQSKKKTMFGYLIEIKAVHFSAFQALFYLTLVLSTGQPLRYSGDRAYVDSKHMFMSKGLLIPRIA